MSAPVVEAFSPGVVFGCGFDADLAADWWSGAGFGGCG
jgi:hypothetical protein